MSNQNTTDTPSESVRTTPWTLSAESRLALTGLLNGFLADVITLRAQFQNAHWNVRGPLFAMWHATYESLYDELAETVDTLAERVTTLGGRPDGSPSAVARTARIPGWSPGADADQAASAILENLARLANSMRPAVSEAEDLGDPVTADMLTGILAALEKSGWIIESHLG